MHGWWDCTSAQTLWKPYPGSKIELPHDPATPLLGVDPKKPKTLLRRHMSSSGILTQMTHMDLTPLTDLVIQRKIKAQTRPRSQRGSEALCPVGVGEMRPPAAGHRPQPPIGGVRCLPGHAVTPLGGTTGQATQRAQEFLADVAQNMPGRHSQTREEFHVQGVFSTR